MFLPSPKETYPRKPHDVGKDGPLRLLDVTYLDGPLRLLDVLVVLGEDEIDLVGHKLHHLFAEHSLHRILRAAGQVGGGLADAARDLVIR